MVWFKDGLNEEDLKKEYRRLAKKWHPDLCDDPKATEYMKEINDQFDQYFENQKIREYAWVDTWKAKAQAQRVRATLLLWLLKDKQNPGKFFSIVERHHIGFWFWSKIVKIKGITDEGQEWNDFRGGLAYCSYGEPDINDVVKLKKLPAKLTPANLKELYFYNKDHFMAGRYDSYVWIKCRAGAFWAEHGEGGYNLFVKAELPEEFLKLGNIDGHEAEYAARSINRVWVSERWVQEAKILREIRGIDIPYVVFHGCTRDEFCEKYDVDVLPRFADNVGLIPIKGDFWFISDPVISFYARHGIIKLYESKHNFRARCGYFDEAVIKNQMHMLTPEDMETVQEYLTETNCLFDTHVNSLIKKRKIAINL